jgi:hypothetical protein
MQLRKTIPGIWVYTTLDAYNAVRTGGVGAFLTKEQAARVERIRQARLLFDGRHREYFLGEERTQFDFPLVRAGGREVPLYLPYNLLGLISNKTSDLLFGEAPLLRVDDATQQDYLSALTERSSLHQVFQSAAIDCSYEAESFFECCVHEGETYIKNIDAAEIFPLGEMLPDGQFKNYVRYQIEDIGTEQAPVLLLLKTQYLPGEIRRELWQLAEDGRPQNRVDLDKWPHRPIGGGFEDVVRTSVDRNTITWIPNLLIRKKAISDYDGAIELQDKVNAANSQIARVLLKHADPKMAFPSALFDEQGNIRSDHDAFTFTDPNNIPKYITWPAELPHAIADRAFAVNALLIKTETSPVLLGLKEGAAPDAYKKVRLEAFNSLTKAQRKAIYWKAGIRRAVGVAQDLENTLAGKVRYARYPIGVELRDGIPVDDNEVANTHATLKAAGLCSTDWSLENRLNDPAAVEKELSRIQKEDAAKAPSIFMGSAAREPGESGPPVGVAAVEDETELDAA